MRIAQCWDDGVSDDIRLTQIFRRLGAKASFNLNAGRHHACREGYWNIKYCKKVERLALSELRSVYDGFLVANHTLTHPYLSRLSIEEATREVREGRDALEQIFGYAVTGFAYPFGDYNDTTQRILEDTGHLYGRTTLCVDRVVPTDTPFAFHSSTHFLAADFWNRFEAVQKQENGIFYFWGHSYELVTEEQWNAFEKSIQRLSEAGEWVDLPELFHTPGA